MQGYRDQASPPQLSEEPENEERFEEVRKHISISCFQTEHESDVNDRETLAFRWGGNTVREEPRLTVLAAVLFSKVIFRTALISDGLIFRTWDDYAYRSL